MTDEMVIDELAKVDGIFVTTHRRNFPDYLNSHDAVQRVIDGMCSKVAVAYHQELKWLCDNDSARFVRSKPALKCEAILKAYGEWVG